MVAVVVHKGPLHSIYFYGCVIVAIRSSSSHPALPLTPPSSCWTGWGVGGGGVSLVLPSAALFVCLIVGKFPECP